MTVIIPELTDVTVLDFDPDIPCDTEQLVTFPECDRPATWFVSIKPPCPHTFEFYLCDEHWEGLRQQTSINWRCNFDYTTFGLGKCIETVERIRP